MRMTVVTTILLMGLCACGVGDPDARDDELQDPANYQGSTRGEITRVIDDGPYGEAMPHIDVTVGRFAKDGVDRFAQTVKDLFSNNHDSHPYYNKLLHPNGVCLTGRWRMTESTPYTGLFSRGVDVPVVARASVAFGNTERGDARAFALALKFFPRDDGHPEKTVNLFLFDRLFGTQRDHWTDADLSNEPPPGDPIAPALFRVGMKVAQETMKTDPIARRPLHPAAMWGVEKRDEAVSPVKMTLVVDPESPRAGDRDFRPELLRILAQGPLRYRVELLGKVRGAARVLAPVTVGEPLNAGTLEFDRAVASFGCDHRIRFRHIPNP